jgi:hypothetical protein
MSKQKLLVGFSGGETSAFMAQWLKLHKSNEYEIIFVFANTGQENEETLEFVNECDKHFGLNVVWVEAIINPINGKGTRAKIVNFETAYRHKLKNGIDPFKAHIAKYGIPNMKNLACTRELKTNTIKAYARELGWKRKEYKTAIGIRTDEIDRVSERREIDNIIYPLVSMQPMTKPMINFYWNQMPFRLKLKGYEGNCMVCHKKSLRKLLTIAKETPEKFNWVIEMEKEFENFIPPTHAHNEKIKLPVRFFRSNLSAKEILEMSKEPFDLATDDAVNYYVQGDLFGHELDTSNGCSESCEAF